MLAMDFPGSRTLIDAIDMAVCQTTPQAITDQLRHSLCQLMRRQHVQLPDCVFTPAQHHYARRELYRSESYGYSVVAMTWGPGQGTAIHDHNGMWCVEGVWQGALDIVQYELITIEQTSQRYHFQCIGSIQAGTGSAGSLIPPHEYHAIRNPSDASIAVSLHIYAAPMQHCTMFRPLPQAPWHRRETRALGLDPID